LLSCRRWCRKAKIFEEPAWALLEVAGAVAWKI
jgi:hypothetical protein